jgi:chromosome segregation ATPase
VIENVNAEKKVLREKVDKIAWNQLQAERTEKDQLQREIENCKAEQEVLRAKVDRMVLESNDNKRDVEIQKKLRTSSETRVSMLEKEIKELKEKGKRAASAMMSTAKELEEEGPRSKKIKT